MKRLRVFDFLFVHSIIAFLVLAHVIPSQEPQIPTNAPVHSGTMGVVFEGVYHYVYATNGVHTELVYYLGTERNGTIRLIFYCSHVTTVVEQTWNDWTFCDKSSDVAFENGDPLWVKGTLIEPSMWYPSSERYEPVFNFTGDLYVFNQGSLSAKS